MRDALNCDSMATSRRLVLRSMRAHKTLQFPPRAEIPDLPTETLCLLLDRLNLVTTGRRPELISRLLSAIPVEDEGESDAEQGEPETNGSESGRHGSAANSPRDSPHVTLHLDVDSGLADRR